MRLERGEAWGWLVWHALSALFLLLVPASLRRGEPFWAVEPEWMLASVVMAGAYGVAALALAWVVLVARVERPALVGTFLCAGLAIAYLGVLVLEARYSRGTLILTSVVFVALLLGSFMPRRGRSAATAGLAGALLLAVGLTATAASGGAEEDVLLPVAVPVELPTTRVTEDRTHLHAVRVTHFQLEEPATIGGALDRIGDDILLATGDGDLFRIRASGSSLEAERLGLRTPMNREAFMEDVAPEVNDAWFRTAGLVVRDLGEDVGIVASHHYWKAEEACFVLRIAETVVAREDLAGGELDRGADAPSWRILHETRPCLPLKDPDEHEFPFAGQQSGGRMRLMGDTALLVTVGDHRFDGWDSEEIFPQDPESDYGKTLIVPLDGGEPRIFTLGHRNPQGLYLESPDRIWITEHGPRGGDELSLLVEGGNYGWPFLTSGTAYGALTWPLAEAAEDGDEAFRTPEFVWNPAIGPSGVIVVEGDHFPQWRGDLLVSSLTANTFFRIRRDGSRVVYVEPIPVGRRIRDVIEGPEGQLVAWADFGWMMTLTRVVEEEGESLVQLCLTCHSEGEQMQGIAPGLAGVFGAPVAAQEGFPYSDALRAVGGTWTEDRLHAFLADPVGFAPGTAMRAAGIEDPGDRQVLIDYLRSLAAPPDR